ncbi:cytochrome c biogenesis protein CcdA [Candidatus Woesearchaeota archaeon]|nr:cytochrome c biogenesis protein CcdA [Candidatus Woesearchaeota archaeon]
MKKILIAILLCVGLAAALEFPPGAQKVLEHELNIGLAITFLIAFIGGIITFTSPCGFVVLPAFFSYIFKERKRALFMTSLFSLGMTLAFIIFGIIAGLVGNFFNTYREFFAIISGLLLILFGIMLMLNKGFSLFDFKVKHKPNHGWGVFFLGFFFAIGWTPCVGPILAGVIVLSAQAGALWKSVALFAFYALGVAAPLLLVSYFSDKYDLSKWFTSKHVRIKILGRTIYTHLYGIIGGLLLVLVGIIMVAYQGTRVFMVTIPQYLPWTMDFFTRTNEKLVENTFFTGTTANAIGIAFAVLVLLVMWQAIRKHGK